MNKILITALLVATTQPLFGQVGYPKLNLRTGKITGMGLSYKGTSKITLPSNSDKENRMNLRLGKLNKIKGGLGSDEIMFDNIIIKHFHNQKFLDAIIPALELIKTKAPKHYNIALKYVKCIKYQDAPGVSWALVSWPKGKHNVITMSKGDLLCDLSDDDIANGWFVCTLVHEIQHIDFDGNKGHPKAQDQSHACYASWYYWDILGIKSHHPNVKNWLLDISTNAGTVAAGTASARSWAKIMSTRR